MAGAPGFVSIAGVELAYGRRNPVSALNGLDLAVDRGGFAAVVGPSGCGKSSLMKLITGLLFPDAGAITIDGKEVDGPLKIAGMAFQNPTLLPWRDVLSNVVLPFEVVDEHRNKVRTHRSLYEDKARTLLRAVGLAGIEHRFPWELSGGMQQRTSARAQARSIPPCLG